jgi:DNA invertase Pin-like site-specific DNA recombinase
MVDEKTIQQIMELRNQGKSLDEIAEATGIPKVTVWRIVKKEEGRKGGGWEGQESS